MRITHVILKNIKSYRDQRIPFDRGTIAIRGHNGAGKSTLVEAIGFALFDALPYKQASFVREGEKSGSVVVGFLSADDGREYEVTRTCGRSSDWYVYDRELDVRVVEQHKDVEDFLRRHMGVDSSVALEDLFNSAIGVPQGAITADFLMKPAERKKRFNSLLQVEDYNKAWENLRESLSYLDTQIKDQQRALDDIRGHTERLPELRAIRDQLTMNEVVLTQRLRELDAESQQLGRLTVTLTGRQQAAQRARAAADQAQARHEMAQQQVTQAGDRLREAEAAAAACAEALPHHKEYLTTAEQLAKTRAQAKERDRLQTALAQTQQVAARARGDRDHARTRLAEADQAARDAAALEDPVARQTALEGERDRLRAEIERLTASEAQRTRLGTEAEANHQLVQKTQDEIAARERMLPLAAEVSARREAWDGLRTAAQLRASHEERLAKLTAELAAAEAKVGQQRQREAKARKDLDTLEQYAGAPEALVAIEGEHASASESARAVEARIGHARQSREQSGAGNCPFLGEPCLNIRQRGENSLATYFDRQIAAEEAQLAPLVARVADLTSQREKVRERAKWYAARDDYASKLDDVREQRADTEQRLADLRAEHVELTGRIAASPDATVQAAARARYEEADQARQATAELPALRESLRRETARRLSLCDQLEALDRDLARLPQAREQLAGHDDALATLGDPRTHRAGLARIAQEHTTRAEALHQAEGALAAHDTQIAAQQKALQPFAGLDDLIARLEAAAARTEEGHQRYLRHEALAGQHQQHKRAHAIAADAERQAAKAYAAATAEFQRAASAFDQAALTRATERMAALGAERGAKTQDLTHTQQQRGLYEAEIARVDGMLGAQKTATDELATLKEMKEELQALRDVIRGAGPGILSAIMRAISTEANRVFGEIIGDRSAHLAWENDFEINLKRDGIDRSFAQLSGGEQMSAALAVRLALLRELSRLDIAFFDEPTQNMDGERRENLAGQLQRVRGFQQLVVISHDDTFEQGLDSVITLEKRGGITELRGAGLQPDEYASPAYPAAG
ncbi:MAG TPA: SMC family ATPase [Ktedonobacterales bacterium]